MFVTPGEDLVGYMATLTSPILLPDFSCVRFWFKKAGEAPVSLRVVVTPGPAYLGEHFEVTLWVLPDTVTSDWQEGQLSIPHYSVDSIEVYIEAKRLEGDWNGGHNEGLIHIDDVEVTRSSECSTVPPEASTKTTTPSSHLTTTPRGSMSEVSCDFTNGDFCQWTSGSTNVKWLIESDIQNTHGVGPLADHTTGDGYFMSLTPTHDQNEGVAVIVTTELTATSAQDFCLRWWYHMDGSDVGTLSVHLITLKKEKDSVIWKKKGFQTAWWTEAFVGIHINENFVLEFKGSQGKNLLSNLAVDDIDMKTAVCPENLQTMKSDEVLCTFEQGNTCGMEVGLETGWTIVKSHTSDHTTGTDQGHVFELRGGSNPATSILKSPFITVEKTKCVGFYYWIGGTEDASLTISLEKDSGVSVGESVQLVKMAEPGWRAIEIGLYRYYGEQMKVMFTGSVGPNKDTVVAIDDVFVNLEMCSPRIAVQCYFENTTCLWMNDPNGLQWFTSDTSSGHTLNGPADDLSKEHYAIFEIVPHHQPGASARMISPTVTRSGIQFTHVLHLYIFCLL
ncbi:hypothetical protein O3P69_016333 [Scylla paramamosain]|uniref:MAM domain-containing protein n=1 Tax=Scylla paramamosain TaxID=85552 RepID=A0AAW0TDL3_SCYPA